MRGIGTDGAATMAGCHNGVVALASFPGPAQLSFACSTENGKAGRAWYLFSLEHDIIGKWRKFSEQTGCVSRIVQLTTCSTLGVYDNCPPLARHVW